MTFIAPRRVRCYLVGRRASKLTPPQAVEAWYSLARQLEAMEEKDIPKFLDLLCAIRAANLFALHKSRQRKIPPMESMDPTGN